MPDSAPRVDFEAVFNAAPGSYLLLAPDLTILAVDDAYLDATMTTREAIVGRPLFQAFPDDPNDPNATGVRNLRASLERALASRRPDRMPVQRYPIRRPEEAGGGFEVRYWSPLNTPVLGSDGEVRYLIHWVEDVTDLVRLKEESQAANDLREREIKARDSKIEAEVFLRTEAMHANRLLAESETRLRLLTEALPQIIWTAAPDGGIEYVNERWTDWTGLPVDAALGDGWAAVVHPDDREPTVRAWAATASSGAARHEHAQRFRMRDGSYRWVLATASAHRGADGSLLRWYGVTTDIHDRVTAEQQRRQAQRLQAAGKLAGGVAHEVNNMLTVVLGFGELVRDRLGGDAVREDLEQMILAAERAAVVTRQLLAYSRQQQLDPVVLDLQRVVREVEPALKRVLGSDRRLLVEWSDPTWVKADRGQLEQVLINLVANARDATGTDAHIRIAVSRRHIDPATLERRHETELVPGMFASVTVEDSGSGMDAETMSQVFEPFFTTKAVGEGTGLGLSMVYGIVKQHGGYVDIASEVGVGTSVTVHLPLVPAPAQGDEAAVVPGATRGYGRILVVEDEAMLRDLARRALERKGYDVVVVTDGASALRLLEGDTPRFDLVLTDVVMPKLNGKELADRVWSRFPGLPVLFMTGYSPQEVLKRGLVIASASVIQKPFTPEALVEAVERLLNAGEREGAGRD
ncbi:MAG TPA: ATP-binding protein [Gemmatimonadales bacterium]|nr:ATP-binding protein [Gemmatimonadales bacterium]